VVMTTVAAGMQLGSISREAPFTYLFGVFCLSLRQAAQTQMN